MSHEKLHQISDRSPDVLVGSVVVAFDRDQSFDGALTGAAHQYESIFTTRAAGLRPPNLRGSASSEG